MSIPVSETKARSIPPERGRLCTAHEHQTGTVWVGEFAYRAREDLAVLFQP